MPIKTLTPLTSSVWHGEAKTPIEEIKAKYDEDMRACWHVPEGSLQVGTDAAGIQLRVLADWLYRHFDSDQYIEAIVSGKKEDETDIHNLNKKALGIGHATRDSAKTFVYGWLLGAGIPKIASILQVNNKEAAIAKDRFEKSIDGLYPLKNQLLPAIANKKWFKGYDGRKVIVPNLHKALAGVFFKAGEGSGYETLD